MDNGIVVSWQSVVSLAAVLAAIFAIVRYYNKGYDWVKRQEKQDKEIEGIKDEQQLLIYGVLACLKGLHEQGCNDSVTAAIAKIEDHLNKKAHA